MNMKTNQGCLWIWKRPQLSDRLQGNVYGNTQDTKRSKIWYFASKLSLQIFQLCPTQTSDETDRCDKFKSVSEGEPIMMKLTSTIQGVLCSICSYSCVRICLSTKMNMCTDRCSYVETLIQVNCKYKQECMYKFKDKWNLKTNLHIYICKFIYSWALFLCTIESLSSKYLESSSYRSTISQLKSLRTLGWMWDPLTIVYNYDTMMTMMMTMTMMMMMMKGVELGEKKWNPRQLHCLLNLDNLSPGRADGKINWKWIWNAEIQICSVRGPAPEFSVLYRVKYRFWRAAALSANCWPRCTSPVHKSVGFRILSPHEESLHACLGFLVKV